MNKKIKNFFCVTLVIVLLPMLTSCWWPARNLCSETTTYNGSKSLTNASYTNLKMHGSSTLNKVHISGWFKCQGSAELLDTVVDGTTDVSGSLTVRDSSVLNGVVHASGISVEGSTLRDIFLKSDKNKTCRFVNSSVGNLYIEGLGDKLVILTNTSAESIVFENSGGIVRLQGNAKVITVTNGIIQDLTNSTTK